jgi:predicted amidohydrolase YtcJ
VKPHRASCVAALVNQRRRPPKPSPRPGAFWNSPTREAISKGITSFQDAGSSFEVINRVKRMIDAGKMHVRLWMMAREYDLKALIANRVIGYGNNMLTLRAIKITGDGALGSRGAWLLEPYS